MNTLLKSAVAGALALGATSAFAIGVPSSNNSDVILYVDAVTATGSSTGVYALDTGITVSSLMPGPYSSTAANSTAFSAAGKVIGPSSTLSTFLTSHSGSTIEWTLEGGQYNNPGFAGGSPTQAQNNNSVAPGSALAVMTSPALTSAFPGVSTASTVQFQAFLNGLQNDLTSDGLTSLTGTETGTATENISAQSKYNFFGGPDLAATGSTAIKLFGFTGNSVNNGTLQSYVLGSATLGADGTLTINGNGGGTAPVPLPAAVWLFGSGLMGLVGVSRRRKAAAAV
jgi:hypothetical protein